MLYSKEGAVPQSELADFQRAWDPDASGRCVECNTAIEHGSVSFAPELAVMSLPSDDTPTDSIPSKPNDLEHPLVVADYSAHGEQVNC